ncbi:MAG TPA: T9SS type A sorting domain-containing protein, partial [Chitinophagales bacterium]|nr:T9SS type A sorting domain-containing protein [Chitinophagales bacterium]
GSITVKANNSCGSSSTSSFTVSVTQSSAAGVSISASQSTICSGANVTFTASPSNGGSSPTYQWKLNGNNVGSNASTYSNASLANSDVVTCNMTSNGTCVSPLSANSNSVTMTVNQAVTPSVSIASGSGSSICAGQSVTFTATPTNGGSSPSYQWKVNGSNVGSGSSTYTTSSLANGDVVSVSMTSNATCATPTSATSNSITISVVSNATPSVSIAANTGNTICSGQSVTFTATPTNGGTSPTYQWKLNGGNVGSNSATYTNASLANGDQVSVQMTSNSACVSTSNATSNTITMSVGSAVAPSVSIVSNVGNSICSGQSVTFTATPANGGGSPGYQWYNNGNVINGAISATYTSATLANGDVISVVMTSSSSCASPSTATSNGITMAVSSSGTASVGISSSLGGSICTGQIPTFTASPVNGGSSPTYQWMINGSNVNGATGATFTPASLNNGDAVSVQMTSNSTCVSQPTVTSLALAISVVQGGAALVSVSSDQGNSICEGTNVTFTATPVNGGGSPTYQWTKNNINTGTNNPVYTDANLNDGDVISCSMTSSLSCASPSGAMSNSVTMTVINTPVVGITLSGNTLVATQGNTYQWYKNNIAIGGATSQNYVPTANGSYTVEVSNSFGCSSTSSAYNVTFLGVDVANPAAAAKIYPNPASGLLYVDLGSLGSVKASGKIFDTDGRMLWENTALNGDVNVIDVNTLPGGVYILQLETAGVSAYRKVVITK